MVNPLQLLALNQSFRNALHLSFHNALHQSFRNAPDLLPVLNLSFHSALHLNSVLIVHLNSPATARKSKIEWNMPFESVNFWFLEHQFNALNLSQLFKLPHHAAADRDRRQVQVQEVKTIAQNCLNVKF